MVWKEECGARRCVVWRLGKGEIRAGTEPECLLPTIKGLHVMTPPRTFPEQGFGASAILVCDGDASHMSETVSRALISLRKEGLLNTRNGETRSGGAQRGAGS